MNKTFKNWYAFIVDHFNISLHSGKTGATVGVVCIGWMSVLVKSESKNGYGNKEEWTRQRKGQGQGQTHGYFDNDFVETWVLLINNFRALTTSLEAIWGYSLAEGDKDILGQWEYSQLWLRYNDTSIYIRQSMSSGIHQNLCIL